MTTLVILRFIIVVAALLSLGLLAIHFSTQETPYGKRGGR